MPTREKTESVQEKGKKTMSELWAESRLLLLDKRLAELKAMTELLAEMKEMTKGKKTMMKEMTESRKRPGTELLAEGNRDDSREISSN